MTLSQLCTTNFGKTRSNMTGSIGVGYTVYDVAGDVVAQRTTSGVYQLQSGSGVYAAYVDFSDNFRGSIVWDTGTSFGTTVFAIEEYNYEANNPLIDQIHVTQSVVHEIVQKLYDIEYGRWQIDPTTKQMIFYREDNSTVVARFNLFDNTGAPTVMDVFDRQRA